MPLFGGRLCFYCLEGSLSNKKNTKKQNRIKDPNDNKQKNYSATIPKAYILGKKKETNQYQTKVTIIEILSHGDEIGSR
jgi:hypothetical protein